MTLIGLAVIGVVVYVFFYGKWQAHQEQQHTEEREQLVMSALEVSRERGLGDLDQLRVDCKTQLFEDPYYEGFFEGLPEEEDDWPAVIEEPYETLESENH